MSSPVHYPNSSDSFPHSVPASPMSPSQSGASKDKARSAKQRQSNEPATHSLPSQRTNDPLFMDSQLDEFQKPGSDSVAGGLHPSLQEVRIWGTDINVKACMSNFELFFTEFREADAAVPKYIQMLQDIEETQIYSVNLDCSNMHDFNPGLYEQLVSYPQEVLPLFDAVINKEYRTLFPEDPSSKQIQTKTSNLLEKKKMRDIDPDDIDCLIAFQTMVTRVSVVIPDMKIGFFRCAACRHEIEVEIDRGRVSQPKICGNSGCKARDAYSLVHNRCGFSDKQLLRVQETPEAIPEGETAQTIDVFCYGDLIDMAKPGDKLEITGVYRAVPVRMNESRRNIKALYRSYVDAVHLKKTPKENAFIELPGEDGARKGASSDCEGSLLSSVRDKEACIRALSEDPDIYQKLVNSIAPSIWELGDIKKGLLCQLFGGVAKKKNNESKFRSEINVLLCGDPGTSKSQLLQYVHKISSRGIYTSGKGSSAVGLTASISRDPETRETVLESGALVLSDKGICCIDEFDKMSDSTRSILHEVMEQQTISIAKAGIICSLNTRTSVLAAANPKESRYDPGLSVVDNITLPPTLLSRFDLIYIVLDKPNERLDRKLAKHLVSLYCLEKDPSTTDFFDVETLTAYISLAKRDVNPRITDEAADCLIKGYLDLRKAGRYRNKKVITATPRQLESLIRLSEALARMKFSDKVLVSDVEEAIRLMKVATQTAATDPKTGIINMDLISIGQNVLERKEIQGNIELLLEIMEDYSVGKPFSFLLSNLNNRLEKKLNFSQFKELIRQMETKELISCKNWQNKDPLIQRVEL